MDCLPIKGIMIFSDMSTGTNSPKVHPPNGTRFYTFQASWLLVFSPPFACFVYWNISCLFLSICVDSIFFPCFECLVAFIMVNCRLIFCGTVDVGCFLSVCRAPQNPLGKLNPLFSTTLYCVLTLQSAVFWICFGFWEILAKILYTRIYQRIIWQ